MVEIRLKYADGTYSDPIDVGRAFTDDTDACNECIRLARTEPGRTYAALKDGVEMYAAKL